jgi:hypothetical protein
MQANSPYNPKQINALEMTISTARFAKYIGHVSGDRERALRLYDWNTAISEAFYTPLQGLEVSLRNALTAQLSQKVRKDWFIRGRAAVFQHPLTVMLDTAANQLISDQKQVTPDAMTAELNFGFWVTLLAPRYDASLWRPALRHAFPHRPRGQERKEAHGALNAIRRLRNRVAHHEPIIGRNLADDHAAILKIVSWICPETAQWITAHSRVPAILPARP